MRYSSDCGYANIERKVFEDLDQKLVWQVWKLFKHRALVHGEYFLRVVGYSARNRILGCFESVQR